MAKLILVYWRDIPAQVIAKQGRKSAKVQLSERFQKAIDRAAMRAGRGGSEAYLEDWRRERRVCSDDLDSAARDMARELESQYSDEQLRQLIASGGYHGGDRSTGD